MRENSLDHNINDRIKELARNGLHAFVRGLPNPLLMVEMRGDDQIDFQTSMRIAGELPQGFVSCQWFEIVKRDVHPFPFVTVGRAANNDIVLKHPALSKCHAAFTRKPDGTFELMDMNSTNGTIVGQHLMEPRAPMVMPDQQHVILGGMIRGTFMYAESAFRTLLTTRAAA